MQSHGDALPAPVSALFPMWEEFKHADFLMSNVVISRNRPLKMSGKILKFSTRFEILAILKINAVSVSTSMFAADAGPGLMKPPAIIWLKNPYVPISRVKQNKF